MQQPSQAQPTAAVCSHANPPTSAPHVVPRHASAHCAGGGGGGGAEQQPEQSQPRLSKTAQWLEPVRSATLLHVPRPQGDEQSPDAVAAMAEAISRSRRSGGDAQKVRAISRGAARAKHTEESCQK